MSVMGQQAVEGFVGAELVGFSHNEEQVELRFADGRKLYGDAYGDCCAHTRIVEVTGDHCTGRPLVGVKQIMYESTTGASYGEAFDVFVTVASFGSDGMYSLIILATCEHNGYYGGCIEWRAGDNQ